jgi:hypothetical protein
VIISIRHHTGDGPAVTSSNSSPRNASAVPCSYETEVRCVKGFKI